jgi:hypothetical protein
MIRFKLCAALAVLLIAGCAGAPEVADEATASAALAAAAPADSSAASETTATGDAQVVDVNELVASTPPPLICKQMLKQGSNVIVTQCLTEKDWKAFQRRQEQDAQEITRMLQGSRYR